jgi:hypothetical protein
MCDKETDTDGDSFVCYKCEASWSMDGGKGDWFDREIACPSRIEWYNRPDLEPKYENIRHVVEPCILADDHSGKHRATDSFYTWDDYDARCLR